MSDKPRELQPGEVGFAGQVTVACPEHGAVIWCACMRTPEQKAEAERRKQELLHALQRLGTTTEGSEVT